MKFFFDRNIARGLVRVIATYENEVEKSGHVVVHEDADERFQPDTDDISIITTLAGERPRPVLLTADINMQKKNPDERTALAGSGLTIVFFRKTFHNLPIHEQTRKLIAVWPEIVAHCQCETPTAFEVSPRGKITRACRTKDL